MSVVVALPLKTQENEHGASHYGYVQGEIWEKGETETMQESQGEKGRVDVLRKAKKPLKRKKRDRQTDPCRDKPSFEWL